jgi:hypothetical protein
MAVVREVALCILVEPDRPFEGAYCLYLQSQKAVKVYRLHCATSKKTALFIFVTVRNPDLTISQAVSSPGISFLTHVS